MIKENTSSRDKYKNKVVNMDLIKNEQLCAAWQHIHSIGSVKDVHGRPMVPCCFHKSFPATTLSF
jgi:hypothetical protein